MYTQGVKIVISVGGGTPKNQTMDYSLWFLAKI